MARATSSTGSVLQVAHNTTVPTFTGEFSKHQRSSVIPPTTFIIAGRSGPWHTSVSIVVIEKIDWTDESGEISLLGDQNDLEMQGGVPSAFIEEAHNV